VTDYGPYSVHPLADAFPLIEGDEFKELVDDIRRNGLGTPIMLTHDKSTIVDGRNRYRACDIALIDPKFHTLPASYTDEQIADYIVSENIRRRHMDTGQLAMLALEVEQHFAELAKKRQSVAATNGNRTRHGLESPVVADRPQPRSREHAAKTVGTSGKSVQRAKAVVRDAPDLAEQVKAGGLKLDNAYKQSRARVAEQRKVEAEPAKQKPHRTEPIMLTLRTHTGDPVAYPQPASRPTFNSTPGDGISWAGWSWNPVTGCLHGCNYCYAREIATSDRYSSAYPVGFTPLYHPERLSAPANTKPGPDGQGRVFVCSMADLYGRWVPEEWIESVHKVERANPQWEYLHLTKFPDRYPDLDLPATAWIGTSVDEQKRVRIAERAFEKVSNVKVKWLSLEPLLEPLEFTDLSMFDWVVIGAQTSTRQPDGFVPAFAPEFEWVARIVSQAREAGCKIHLKPNLASNPGMRLPNEYPFGDSNDTENTSSESNQSGSRTSLDGDRSTSHARTP
jgi:protein gp37/ParB-like chromosome segregation protein Spo0J